MYLPHSNYADLSFLFTIHPRREDEPAFFAPSIWRYWRRTNATPYYLNLHNGEVAHTLILGMTGSGKSFLCNFLLTNAQKYRPQTLHLRYWRLFPVAHGDLRGTYLNVGQESRDFTINPFSLPESKENSNSYSLSFGCSSRATTSVYRLDFKEERKLLGGDRADVCGRSGAAHAFNISARSSVSWKEAVAPLDQRGSVRIPLRQRRRHASVSPSFKPSTSPAGVTLPKFWNRCLFYVLHRASNEIANPAKLATFKTFLLDEAWLFIKTRPIRSYIVAAQKTWRKHNACE